MKISIDGNVGAGKSSVIDALATVFPTVTMRTEPVDEWTELLTLYHKEPATWALAMNLKVLMSFAGLDKHDSLFVERSPLSCRHVFGQMECNDRRFDKLQWDLFNEYCDLLGWEPDVIIFIDTPAATCLTRVERRGRPCEASIDLEYLKRLEFQYQTMLKMCQHNGLPVVMIDGTQPREKVRADVIAAILKLDTQLQSRNASDK